MQCKTQVNHRELLAARIIKRHYGISCVSMAEVRTEIANVQRKHASGTLDDSQLHLWARLCNAGILE